jgi:cysteine synthase A
MLQMKRLAPPGSADIFAKLEYLNPGGSVKDRAAIGLIEHAERTGQLKPGGTVIEATAGNTGIGLALIGVSRGYKVRLFVPEKFSEEKVIIMRALGAEVIRTPEAEGMQGAIQRARDLLASAREIFEQMERRIDAITVGCGTAGTFTGVARFLKERLAKVHAVAVETQGSILGGGKAGPHKVEGIGNSFIPGNFDQSVCDEVMMVTDEQAFGMVKELAAREGVLGGSSSGANLYAAVEIAKRLGAGKRVVTLVPDSAERYLSKKIFEGGV